MFLPYHLYRKVLEEVKKLTIEDNKKAKVLNPKQHSTFDNPKLKPSSVVGKPNPKPQQVHPHDNYASPDNPCQDVINQVISVAPLMVWMNQVLSAPDDHLLQLDSTSL